jgi:hypothetical protein
MHGRTRDDRRVDFALRAIRDRLPARGVPFGVKTEFDIGGFNRKLVLGNEVVFGAVNANRSHYAQASSALAAAERSWLDRIITRRVPLSHWREAFTRAPTTSRSCWNSRRWHRGSKTMQ